MEFFPVKWQEKNAKQGTSRSVINSLLYVHFPKNNWLFLKLYEFYDDMRCERSCAFEAVFVYYGLKNKVLKI